MFAKEDRTRDLSSTEGFADPVLAVAHFDQLQRNFSPEAFRELVDIYLGQAGCLVREITQALAERDGDRAGAAAHKLRGSSATLGARALTDLCATLELQASDDDPLAVAGMSTKLQGALDATVRALESELSKVQRAGADR
ncbi:MAG TPA: Hpt domain-containing protein [Solirubrobacteraceae bacterium]|nr:Hpt domain-containing protein [Solirubrobacteraceae bacterium]